MKHIDDAITHIYRTAYSSYFKKLGVKKGKGCLKQLSLMIIFRENDILSSRKKISI